MAATGSAACARRVLYAMAIVWECDKWWWRRLNNLQHMRHRTKSINGRRTQTVPTSHRIVTYIQSQRAIDSETNTDSMLMIKCERQQQEAVTAHECSLPSPGSLAWSRPSCEPSIAYKLKMLQANYYRRSQHSASFWFVITFRFFDSERISLEYNFSAIDQSMAFSLRPMKRGKKKLSAKMPLRLIVRITVNFSCCVALKQF